MAHFKFIVQKKITDDIISLACICVIIWILASDLAIAYRVLIILAFVLLTAPFNHKVLKIYDDKLVYSYPYINIVSNIMYDDIVEVNFRRLNYSMRGEFMDLEICYSKSIKRTICIPLKRHDLNGELWLHFKNKGVRLKTNYEEFDKL